MNSPSEPSGIEMPSFLQTPLSCPGTPKKKTHAKPFRFNGRPRTWCDYLHKSLSLTQSSCVMHHCGIKRTYKNHIYSANVRNHFNRCWETIGIILIWRWMGGPHLFVLFFAPQMQCSVESVSHNHGAVRTHLAAVETQSVATDLPHAHLVGKNPRWGRPVTIRHHAGGGRWSGAWTATHGLGYSKSLSNQGPLFPTTWVFCKDSGSIDRKEADIVCSLLAEDYEAR